jgi:hypothetical protein
MPETRIAIMNDPYYIDKNLIDHSLYFLNFWLINANIPHFFLDSIGNKWCYPR